MSNQWLRLWHDLPNDPKWRTIARVANQPISLVIATYVHLLVSASQNVTRGHVTVTNEDLASALDVTDECVCSVISAMQGRVLDGDRLTGWETRQPKREDAGSLDTGAKSAAQRKREQRERERQKQGESQAVTDGHDESHNVTLDKDKEEIIREIEYARTETQTLAGRACVLMRQAGCVQTNPSNQNLLAALAEGITPETLADFAANAPDHSFAYAIKAARNEHAKGVTPITTTGATHGNAKQSRKLSAVEQVRESNRRAEQRERSFIEGTAEVLGAHG